MEVVAVFFIRHALRDTFPLRGPSLSVCFADISPILWESLPTGKARFFAKTLRRETPQGDTAVSAQNDGRTQFAPTTGKLLIL